jgi:hypothetical protein
MDYYFRISLHIFLPALDLCDLNDTELKSYKRGGFYVGKSEFHCGQYNFWTNIRYGEGPNKTEDAAGRMLV